MRLVRGCDRLTSLQMLIDYWLIDIMWQGGPLCFSKLDFAVAWFIRESMAVQIFLSALWDPTISWRTGRYRLRCGGTAEEILDV